MLLAIRNLTRSALPRLPYRQLVKQVLGSKYDLSLVLIGNTRSRTLNRIWRGKDRPANILTFPLDQNTGEIFLNLDQTSGVHLRHLFIHGLLHLKGYGHGSRMEALEREIISFFTRHESNHRHRTRRRHNVDQSRSLRSH